MKYLFLVLLLFSCNMKEEPKIVPCPEIPKIGESHQIQVGSCYRYPNSNQNDVHVKVLKLYSESEILGEFIVLKQYFTDIHNNLNIARHLKEIDCSMFDDLKSLSKGFKEE